MICINLLPWREARLQRLKSRLAWQMLYSLALPVVLTGVAWLIFRYEIIRISDEIDSYLNSNQKIISILDEYARDQDQEKLLIQQLNRVDQLDDMRKRIPEALAILTREKLAHPVEYLQIDRNRVLVRGLEWKQGDAMTLFQRLKSDNRFCQVSLLPSTNRSELHGTGSFELHARFCNENKDT